MDKLATHEVGLEVARRQLSESEDKIKQLKIENGLLQSSLNSQKSLFDENAQLRRTVESLTAQVSKLEQENKCQEQIIDKQQSQRQAIALDQKTERQKDAQIKKELEDQIKKLEDKLSLADVEYNELVKIHEENKKSKLDLLEANNRLQQQVELGNETVQILQQQLKIAEQKSVDSECSKHQSYLGEIDQLSRTVDTQKRAIAELEQQLKEERLKSRKAAEQASPRVRMDQL